MNACLRVSDRTSVCQCPRIGVLCLLLAVERSHLLCELLARQQRVAARLQTVVVYCLRRVVQEFGYAHAVGYAYAHERVDAQFGVEHLRIGQRDAALGLEQGVEPLYEVGVRGDERYVEVAVEVA